MEIRPTGQADSIDQDTGIMAYIVLDLPAESIHTEGGMDDLRKVIPLPIPMKADKIIGYFIPDGKSPPAGFPSTFQWDMPGNLKPSDVTGEGLILNNDDPPGILTLKDGWFCALSEKFRVSSLYELFLDVTARMGKIEVNASIKCHGSVSQGAEIISGGDIEIAGLVEDASVTAKGSIIAKGGIAGAGEGKLVAGKNVYSQFIQQATVEAPGSIVVDGPVMNSTVLCGQKLHIRPPGLLVGGHVRVRDLLEVERIGSEAALKTEVDLGANPFQRVHLEGIQEDVKKITDDIEKIKTSIKHVEENLPGGLRFSAANMLNSLFNAADYVQQNKENMSEEERELLNKFGSGIMRLTRMNDELVVKKKELAELMEGETWNEKAQVKISKIAHPGTIIRLVDAVLAMDKEYEHVVIYYKAPEGDTQKKGEIEINYLQ